jgi:hypothetical protein
MPDNVVINPGSGGATIAADDIGSGVKAQRVKVGYGPDGSLVDVSPASPLPTQVQPGGTVGADRAAVTTPGTPTRLPAHAGIYGLTLRAMPGNQGLIYIGGPTVTFLSGFPLAAGEAMSLDVNNSNAVYLDAQDAGDAVALVWVST